jgi:threonine dehydrogenase-like Zn-dependent dehydrogenase
VAALTGGAIRRITAGRLTRATGFRPCTRRSTSSAGAEAIPVVGVYGGMIRPAADADAVRRQVQLRMGQANAKRWVLQIMLLPPDGDPLGVDEFASHRLPLEQAPEAYERFQKKQDGFADVLLRP